MRHSLVLKLYIALHGGRAVGLVLGRLQFLAEANNAVHGQFGTVPLESRIECMALVRQQKLLSFAAGLTVAGISYVSTQVGDKLHAQHRYYQMKRA